MSIGQILINEVGEQTDAHIEQKLNKTNFFHLFKFPFLYPV